MTELATKLNDLLKNSEEAQEYFKLKTFLQNDEYITLFLKNIAQVQKETQEALKANDTKIYLKKRKEMEIMKDEFTNHPVIQNYIQVRAELEDLLEQVVTILSD